MISKKYRSPHQRVYMIFVEIVTVVEARKIPLHIKNKSYRLRISFEEVHSDPRCWIGTFNLSRSLSVSWYCQTLSWIWAWRSVRDLDQRGDWRRLRWFKILRGLSFIIIGNWIPCDRYGAFGQWTCLYPSRLHSRAIFHLIIYCGHVYFFFLVNQITIAFATCCMDDLALIILGAKEYSTKTCELVAKPFLVSDGNHGSVLACLMFLLRSIQHIPYYPFLTVPLLLSHNPASGCFSWTSCYGECPPSLPVITSITPLGRCAPFRDEDKPLSVPAFMQLRTTSVIVCYKSRGSSTLICADAGCSCQASLCSTSSPHLDASLICHRRLSNHTKACLRASTCS